MKLNGMRIVKVNDTYFMPLPREAWRFAGSCQCGHCNGTAWWDTLAMSPGLSYTWTVHYPELHGYPKAYPGKEEHP
jgi:hypothetical protein